MLKHLIVMHLDSASGICSKIKINFINKNHNGFDSLHHITKPLLLNILEAVLLGLKLSFNTQSF